MRPRISCIFPALAACFLFLLTGCAGGVPKADYLPGQVPAEGSRPAPLKLSRASLRLPLGSDIGQASPRCGFGYEKVGRNAVRGEIDHEAMLDAFRDALEGQGYDVVHAIDIDPEFDPDYETARTEYVASAKITGLNVKMCHSDANTVFFFLETPAGISGEMHMSVEWSVFDALRRKTVYKTTTEGYAKRRIPNEEGVALMLADGFEMAAHNFGADRNLHDLLFFGRAPAGWQKEEGAHDDESRRRFEPDEPVSVAPLPLSAIPFEQHAERSRRAAVMIQTGDGAHGSGFFITKQGHILTNSHVAGGALRVRVVTADRADKMTAEVLRADRARDVALLKLEEIPAGLDILTLPLRLEWPKVSERVFAVGAPRQAKLQDTVTGGIVSAHRKDMRFGDNLRLNYIQGNVTIHGGNSGGPLLDANGNIVGLSVAGMGMDEEKRGANLNLFIPIAEALWVLGIDHP